MLGSEAEVFRLADEVAKRRRKGQQNPAGARTSGLRWDERRHRSAHRGGSLAGEGASRRLEQTHNGPQGCQGSDVSAERYGGRLQDRTAWCLSFFLYDAATT